MQARLNNALSSTFGIAACVGGIIGLGIMRTPGEIAAVIDQPAPYLGLWIAIGLFVLLSTAVVVELVGMAPRSGGIYILVRRAYGPYSGFLIGWTDWVAFAATYALKAVVVMEYFALLAPALKPWITPAAVAVTTAFAALQLAGARAAAGVQQFAATLIGVLMICFTLALALASIGGPHAGEPVGQSFSDPDLAAYGLVIASVVFAYDGWLFASYFGGEIKGGGAAVARACIRGTVIVALIYVAINAALVTSVSLPSLVGHDLALAQALDLALFEGAGLAVVFAAISILLLQQNLGYMAASRVLYALSTDGLGTEKAKKVSHRGTPVGAVALTWALTVGLVIAGGFNFLLNLTVLLYVCLYLALLVGVVLLRRREPDAERPYRALGHPFSSIVGIIGWVGLSVLIAYGAPESAVYAVALIAVSIPAYLALQSLKKHAPQEPVDAA